ncbi:hypothetical protein RRG08_025726 [Elysia crispata]|uniref:Major facilitator superfamily (MFS) profile domain-containing protein n=1 Tax=Elysia crispata TaxID=231223 RepID=A0AAE1AGM3_9GAST|nr:hypothetical protein RRG08_025726 [Elysia crispata]
MGSSKVGCDENSSNKNDVTLEFDTENTSGVPIDRGWAWMTVLGCFGIYVLVVGGIKSLGVLMVEIRDRFDDISAKQMGLVQGLTYTLMMGLGLATNLLSARFTCRAMVFLGGLLASLGFTLTAFVNRFWMIYLTYSMAIGIGFALCYIPSIVFVGSYFKKHRSLANGLAVAGSGVGSFALPNLMRVMLKEYGLPGCCMLLGALMLHVCVFGLLFRPHTAYRKIQNNDETKSRAVVTNVSVMRSEVSADDFTDGESVLLAPHDVQISEPKDVYDYNNILDFRGPQRDEKETSICRTDDQIIKEENKCQSNVQPSSEEEALLQSPTINDTQGNPNLASPGSVDDNPDIENLERISCRKANKSLFEWTLLTDPVLFLYIIFSFLVGVAYPNIFFMLPLHAGNIGEDRDRSALLLSFIGLTDLLGRLFIGWFTDLKLFERRYVMVLFAFLSGLLCLLVPFLKTFGGLAAYAVGYGFSAGSYVTLIPVVLSDTLGPEKLPSSYGMVAMAMSTTLIPAPLVCGQIRDSTGSWDYAFLFAGTFVVFGSLFPLLQPCVQKRRTTHQIEMKENKNTSL